MLCYSDAGNLVSHALAQITSYIYFYFLEHIKTKKPLNLNPKSKTFKGIEDIKLTFERFFKKNPRDIASNSDCHNYLLYKTDRSVIRIPYKMVKANEHIAVPNT